MNKTRIDQVTWDDELTWDLYREGNTKGVFQLDKNLGRTWAKKLQPGNIEELAGLLSVIRPGVLKAKIGDKTLAQIYADRKALLEEVTYIHESLEDILKPTYGILIYQEQAMRIAQKLAGFSESEADVLRKAIGKKKADLMAEVKKDFIEGCKNVGIVDEATADEIFGWIEKSSRYSFNKSHAVAYAVDSYWSAYRKAHNTQEFFLTWLDYARFKQDSHQEIYELVTASKVYDFEIRTPNLTNFQPNFNYKGGCIYFGMKNIKSLTGVNGDSAIKAVLEFEKEINKKCKDATWLELLIYYSPKINSICFKTLASIGFFRGIKEEVSRNKALYEYGVFKNVNKTELKWILDNYPKKKWKTLEECLKELAPLKKEGGGTTRETRKQTILNEIKMLRNPPYDLVDDPEWIIDQETKFLGCPVSMAKIDAFNTRTCNTTCKDLINGKKGKNLTVAANISRLVTHKIKKDGPNKGKEMCFLTIEDGTASFDSVVVFPEAREENKYSLVEDNNVILQGYVEKDSDSLVIEKVIEI